MNLFSKEKQTHRLRELTCYQQEWVGGGHILGVWD